MPNPLKKAAKFENKMLNKLDKADKKASKSTGMEYEPKVKKRHMKTKK